MRSSLNKQMKISWAKISVLEFVSVKRIAQVVGEKLEALETEKCPLSTGYQCKSIKNGCFLDRQTRRVILFGRSLKQFLVDHLHVRVSLKVSLKLLRDCQPLSYQENEVVHVIFSKDLQSLYLMLFNLMKAMPRCTLTPITSTKYSLVTKMTKPLDFDDFGQFSLFLTWHRSVMTSQSRHTQILILTWYQWLKEIHS